MRYDLIDLGRDVLARLTTPISQDFVASLGNGTTTLPNAVECKRTGEAAPSSRGTEALNLVCN